MKVFFAHNGVDDGHANVFTSTVDTTLPGPAEPIAKPNFVLYGSIVLVVVAAAVIALQYFKRKNAPKVEPPKEPEAPIFKPTEPTPPKE